MAYAVNHPLCSWKIGTHNPNWNSCAYMCMKIHHILGHVMYVCSVHSRLLQVHPTERRLYISCMWWTNFHESVEYNSCGMNGHSFSLPVSFRQRCLAMSDIYFITLKLLFGYILLVKEGLGQHTFSIYSSKINQRRNATFNLLHGATLRSLLEFLSAGIYFGFYWV